MEHDLKTWKRNPEWTTINETQFIDGLISGEYRGDRILNEKTPTQLLKGYIRHAKNRKRWGTFGTETNFGWLGVKPDVVIKYAQDRLEQLGG